MKKLFWRLLSLFAIILVSVSCSSDPDSYENLLDDEKESISNYISRNGIQVVNDWPADNAWGNNVYFKTPNGVYIHMVDLGDNTKQVYSGQLVIYRYYKISLDAVPDTIVRGWTATEMPYPESFTYNNSSEAIPAFHEAVKYMKNNLSSVKLIVPSKQGNSTDQDAVKAYAYDLKINLGD